MWAWSQKIENLSIEYKNKKKEILTKKENSPYFMYTYNAKPGHSQNSGKCLANEKVTLKVINPHQQI